MRYIQTLSQEVNEDIEKYLIEKERSIRKMFYKQREEIFSYLLPLKKRVVDKHTDKSDWIIEIQQMNRIIAYVKEHSFLPESYSDMLDEIEERLTDTGLTEFEEKKLLSKR